MQLQIDSFNFKVLYIDPPWEYRNKKTGGSMESGASQKYNTLTIQELCDFPINRFANKNSVIFLWVPCPLSVIEAPQVIKAWGYKFKTKIYWRKIMSLGMGFWFRGQVEELWLCTKGKVKAFRCQECNFGQSKVEQHSRKPQWARDKIEKALQPYPDLLNNKVELFATEYPEGWKVWGDQVKSDIDFVYEP